MVKEKDSVNKLLTEYGISNVQLERMLRARQTKPKKLISKEVENRFAFAIIADTHLCSIEERLDDLASFYEEVRKRDIKTVVHAGD